MTELSAQLARCAALDQINNGAAVAFKTWVHRFVPRIRQQERASDQLKVIIGNLVDQAQDVSFAGVLRAAGKSRAQIIDAGIAMLRAGTGGSPGASSLGLHLLADGVFAAGDLLDPERAPLVLREAIRLWPPVAMICRLSLRDVVVEGYSIPGGSEISISPYATQGTAPDYVDPEVFRPERWVGLHPHAGAWIPYGAGPHWCVGQPLAEAESAVVLPALAERFIFRRNGPMGEMVADTIMHPVDETLVVTRR